MTCPGNVLVVAGLDPTAGAGLLADARVAGAFGLRAVGVATALTEQDTAGVRSANVVPVEVIGAQLHALLADVEVVAVKIGMLGSEAVADAVADALALTDAPVVWDPVLHPTRGRVPLYTGSPARAMQLLAPHVTALTPNLAEASALTGGAPIADVAGMRRAGEALRAAGMRGVVVTGGHLPGATADGEARTTAATDVVVTAAGATEITGPWIDGGPVHGTGCALSTAIACRLARGDTLEGAVGAAKDFLASKLVAVQRPGRGLPAVV